jgi:hypothetical protein
VTPDQLDPEQNAADREEIAGLVATAGAEGTSGETAGLGLDRDGGDGGGNARRMSAACRRSGCPA